MIGHNDERSLSRNVSKVFGRTVRLDIQNPQSMPSEPMARVLRKLLIQSAERAQIERPGEKEPRGGQSRAAQGRSRRGFDVKWVARHVRGFQLSVFSYQFLCESGL